MSDFTIVEKKEHHQASAPTKKSKTSTPDLNRKSPVKIETAQSRSRSSSELVKPVTKPVHERVTKGPKYLTETEDSTSASLSLSTTETERRKEQINTIREKHKDLFEEDGFDFDLHSNALTIHFQRKGVATKDKLFFFSKICVLMPKIVSIDLKNCNICDDKECLQNLSQLKHLKNITLNLKNPDYEALANLFKNFEGRRLQVKLVYQFDRKRKTEVFDLRVLKKTLDKEGRIQLNEADDKAHFLTISSSAITGRLLSTFLQIVPFVQGLTLKSCENIDTTFFHILKDRHIHYFNFLNCPSFDTEKLTSSLRGYTRWGVPIPVVYSLALSNAGSSPYFITKDEDEIIREYKKESSKMDQYENILKDLKDRPSFVSFVVTHSIAFEYNERDFRALPFIFPELEYLTVTLNDDNIIFPVDFFSKLLKLKEIKFILGEETKFDYEYIPEFLKICMESDFCPKITVERPSTKERDVFTVTRVRETPKVKRKIGTLSAKKEFINLTFSTSMMPTNALRTILLAMSKINLFTLQGCKNLKGLNPAVLKQEIPHIRSYQIIDSDGLENLNFMASRDAKLKHFDTKTPGLQATKKDTALIKSFYEEEKKNPSTISKKLSKGFAQPGITQYESPNVFASTLQAIPFQYPNLRSLTLKDCYPTPSDGFLAFPYMITLKELTLESDEKIPGEYLERILTIFEGRNLKLMIAGSQEILSSTSTKSQQKGMEPEITEEKPAISFNNDVAGSDTQTYDLTKTQWDIIIKLSEAKSSSERAALGQELSETGFKPNLTLTKLTTDASDDLLMATPFLFPNLQEIDFISSSLSLSTVGIQHFKKIKPKSLRTINIFNAGMKGEELKAFKKLGCKIIE